MIWYLGRNLTLVFYTYLRLHWCLVLKVCSVLQLGLLSKTTLRPVAMISTPVDHESRPQLMSQARPRVMAAQASIPNVHMETVLIRTTATPLSKKSIR